MTRPAVSVVIPFLGDAGAAGTLLRMLERIETGAGDELLIADNTREGIVAPLARDPIRVVAAAERRSAAHARNTGAAAASGEWLLFMDADCVPPRNLLDAYLGEPPQAECGIIAGEVEGLAGQPAFLARWARSRRGRWVAHHQSWGPYPAGVTANLLVRRAAFEQLRGFRIGGGGDLDLCWRAQAQGWRLVYRPDVAIGHRDRERLRELRAQAIAYGGHQRRLRELHGSAVPRQPLVAPVGRSIAGTIGYFAVDRLDPRARRPYDRAGFKLVDGYWACLQRWGWLTRGRRAGNAD